jgi:hypothetical protein
MVHHGRLPADVVLEIARAMLADLLVLEKAGICHADISASSLILTDSGDATLAMPGLRAILRPEEGYAHADLLPEAYDALAPERVAAGTCPNVASDIYACGCVWWHLLCGRPPLAGGDSLAKLRAAQTGVVGEVRRFAPDVSPTLAAAIAACLQREPNQRPESMTRLAALLGSSTRGGRESLLDCLERTGRPTVRWTTRVRSVRRSRRTPLWVAGAVCCLITAIAIVWPTAKPQRVASGPLSVASEDKPKTLPRPVLSNAGEAKASVMVNEGPQTDMQKDHVVPVTYVQPEVKKPADLVLPSGKMIDAATIQLREGLRVCGEAGHRATVRVPEDGFVIDKENVRFENIDFVRQVASRADDESSQTAMVQLLTSRVDFSGCSFLSAKRTASPAIRWTYPSRTAKTELSLPSGRLRLTDCLLHQIGAGVECHTIGALAMEFRNVLQVEAGPLIRLDHCPQSDEPISLVLGQVTLREAGPLLECLTPRIESQPAEIDIVATACAFAPSADGPLVRWVGRESPDRLLASIRWTGQGALVTPRSPIVSWQGPDGQDQPLDESTLSIAGLVRSEVEFAGAVSNSPTTSRLRRWQAPLQSADPPGIDPGTIPQVPR